MSIFYNNKLKEEKVMREQDHGTIEEDWGLRIEGMVVIGSGGSGA